MPPDPPPTPEIVTMMAARSAAVETARFPPDEFEGMKTSRYEYAIYDSLVIAKSIYKRIPDRS